MFLLNLIICNVGNGRYATFILKSYFRWANTPVLERSKLMLKIADLIEARQSELAELESRDQGKPVWLSKSVDIPRLMHNFRSFATAVLHHVNRLFTRPPVKNCLFAFYCGRGKRQTYNSLIQYID